MIDLQIGRFVNAFNGVSSWTQMAYMVDRNTDMTVMPRAHEDIVRDVTTLLDISQRCNFGVIEVWAKESLEELQKFSPLPDGTCIYPAVPRVRLHASIGRLKDAVIGEAQTRYALLLDSHSRELWEPTHPLFGDEFKNAFPRANYDLDEASKCLALGRGTAAVFHLMRIMEAGLHAVHACLGIPVSLVGTDRNWGNILKRVREAIAARGNRWEEKEQFQELYALLDAVKDAWRNATMHIESKYTPDESDHVFRMVRGFMKKLSSRMDENGDPKALGR